MCRRFLERCFGRRAFLVFCCGLFSISSRLALADGGVIQIRKEAGPFRITLFSTPAPLRAGPADLSVLVESAKSGETLLDAKVVLLLQPLRGADASKRLELEATRAQATNKLLYAALPDLSEQGEWSVRIDVQEGSRHASAAGTIEVLPPPPALLADWPYFAAVPLLIGLFILNQYLRRRQLASVRARRAQGQ